MISQNFADWYNLNKEKLTEKRAFLGFDGFVDRIAAIDKVPHMRTFAEYLNDRDGMSGTLELVKKAVKMGGNMPIMANALGCMGISCDCVGALGEGGVLNEVFGDMSERCQLYPVAAPGSCLALEFETGKLMLADNLSVKTLDYDALIHAVGKEALTAMYSRADLIGCLNWSELHRMPSILRGTLRDIMPAVKNGGKRPIVLFDLSDCSSRSKDDLEEALRLMARYSEFAMTVLSLNENETRCLARVYLSKDPGSFESMKPAELQTNVQRLSDVLGMQTLVIRGNKFTYAVEKNNAQAFTVVSTCYVNKPVLMTGAGDNFNAGMAAALLMGGNWEKALTLGTLEASRYIEYGSSATPEELIKYLNKRRLSQ